MTGDTLAVLDVPLVDGQLDAQQLAAVAPELTVRGPDGEVWGVDAERVTHALWAIARTLRDELALERRRSEQLSRRTRWLYKTVTGHELPPEEEP